MLTLISAFQINRAYVGKSTYVIFLKHQHNIPKRLNVTLRAPIAKNALFEKLHICFCFIYQQFVTSNAVRKKLKTYFITF